MKTKTTKNATTRAITTLPPSPAEERHGRMIRYSLAMGVRLVCVIAALVVPFGWWTLVPALGAVILPYVAVVLANVGQEGIHGEVEAPGAIEIYKPQAGYDPSSFTGETFQADSHPDRDR